MQKHHLLFLAALNAAIAIILGAAGTHTGLYDPSASDSWHNATYYQLIHSVAVFAIITNISNLNAKLATISGCLLLIGSIFFSFAIYLKYTTTIAAIIYLTPVGGSLMILGWLLTAWSAITAKTSKAN